MGCITFSSVTYLIIIYGHIFVHITNVVKCDEIPTANPEKNRENFPSILKCCKQNELLKKTDDGTYDCTRPDYVTSYMFFNSTYFPKNCTKDEFCVDEEFPKDIRMYHEKRVLKLKCPEDDPVVLKLSKNTFRKCCPLNKVYNPGVHQCEMATRGMDEGFEFVRALGVVQDSGSIQDVVFTGDLESSVQVKNVHSQNAIPIFIQYGLPDCKSAIVDYFKGDLKDMISYIDNPLNKAEGFCADKTAVNSSLNYVVRVCEKPSKVCKTRKSDSKIPCFWKCCRDGSTYVNGSKCLPNFKYGYSVPDAKDRFRDFDGSFAILQPQPCSKYIARPNHEFYIDDIGTIHMKENKAWNEYDALSDSYCMEYLEKGNMSGYNLFLCIKSSTAEYDARGTCLIISAVFLLLTVIGYLILPELTNLYGKTLIIYCTSLMVANICLAVALFENSEGTGSTLCKVLGYAIAFTFLAAFSWLNVMCFDIWFTFSALRAAGVNQKARDKKKFLWYNVYAWSVPLVIVSIILILNLTDALDEMYMPYIGKSQCFFELRKERAYGHLIFFLIPESILIFLNCYFFISTTYYCIKVKNEINKMRDSVKKDKRKKLNADKERLAICLRLFVVMGVLWVMEVVSSIVSFKENPVLAGIETLFDYCNALQGVFIFIIYMLKRKVFKSIKKKLGLILPRRISETETSSLTASTSLITNTNGICLPNRKISSNANRADATKI